MKTMFRILGIIAIAVLFAFTACEGPMGPAGEDGSGVLSEIPESSGLRGTTWTHAEATNVKTWSFSADGKTIVATGANSENSQTITIGSVVVVESGGSLGTSYIIQGICTSSTGTWSAGFTFNNTFHVRETYLTVGTSADQFQKQQ